MSDHPANDPSHPDHARHIVAWTRRAAASDVIVDPANPRPLTPEQIRAGIAPENMPEKVPEIIFASRGAR